jgi:hypothetical protein
MSSQTNWEWTAPNGKYSALGISKHEGQKGKVNWYGSRPTIEEIVAYVEKRGRKHCDLLIYDNTQSPIKLVKIIEDFNLDKAKIWADDARKKMPGTSPITYSLTHPSTQALTQTKG